MKRIKKMVTYTIVAAMVLSVGYFSEWKTYAENEQPTYDENPGDIVTFVNEPAETMTVPDLLLEDDETKTTIQSGEITSDNGINNAKPGKVKIKKAIKKKSAKKLIIKIEKIKGAKGYQIRVYKNRKKAKKNKKPLVKKTIKKNVKKLIIKNKKLRNKKKLFVRVRAFNYKAKGKKIFGAWSKVKRVKMKKSRK